MEDMANQPPEETELLMMKRFACGNMLHLLDGPFPRADTLRNLLVEGGTYDDFNQMVDALKNIETDDIVRLTQKWLNPADMIEVVIG
jgi:predicted Zn-dependent peptidase